MASLAASFSAWPEWVRWASMAFIIIGSAMLCRRYAVCRLVAGIALVFVGLLLLGALPWPPIAVKQQVIELVVLSIGAIWVCEELIALLQQRSV
jgi:hypothetical protein